MSEELKKEELSFEEAMNRLEKIVEQLETGDAPLEEAIKLFQEGVALSKTCSDKLKNVEKQVNMLLEEEGKSIQKAFELEGEPS